MEDKNIVETEQLQETLEKIRKIVESLISIINKTIQEIWSKINGNLLVEYQKLYNQSHWKHIKKAKRYVKVRRHNCEDIGRAYSRKIKHYQKQIQQFKNLSIQ